MCGICGLINFNSNSKIDEDILLRMRDNLTHRGPDEGGIYLKNNPKPAVGLGHRRLKIIDLSQAGFQPMYNEDGSIWIVFNGEIYNFKELRSDLLTKGHVFKSKTDTEVAVHLYEQEGVDFVKRLRGMFAFALWDINKKVLVLGRDRVGKKPLFYHYKGGIFSFASELNSLLSSGFIDKQINQQAINYYLTFGYIPAPWTIYKNVFKLLPAELLVFKDEKISLNKYWQLNYSPENNISESEASIETLSLFEEAVKLRMNSDVPLGAFLSGGIDSSAVVALMSMLSGERVKTFSVGFQEKDYDELLYAKKIAKRYNTDHHELIVKPNAIEVLPLLVERYGEPYADSSCIPSFYIARETRRFVTVALNGDGGDECFAGYERYFAMQVSENISKLPPLIKNIIMSTHNILPDSIYQKSNLRRIKRFLEGSLLPYSQRYLRWVSIFNDTLKKELYSDIFLNSIGFDNPNSFIEGFMGEPADNNFLDNILNTDVNTYLPYDLLVKVDITSMANSLEVRSPFLDHKLMEFVAVLPDKFKIKFGNRKYLLKKIIEKFVPAENIKRRKMGFGVPVDIWFRGELKDFLREVLLSENSLKRKYFNKDFVQGMIKSHCDGKYDYSMQLWTLLMLELWHNRFID